MLILYDDYGVPIHIGDGQFAFIQKIWGWYFDIIRTDDFTSKILHINAGSKISWQRHFKRSEDWTILSGCGTMRVASSPGEPSKFFFVEPGSKIHVDVEEMHQVIASGGTSLVIYEEQRGICDENDIERFEV